MHSEGTVRLVGTRWPSQRSDGTLAVAVRYVVARPEGRAALQHYVDEWPQTHAEAYALGLRELTTSPHVVADAARLDVVFEANAGSRYWKDVMVAFIRDVPTDAGLEFQGFADLVGGGLRPARPGQAPER
jgi:hypothetical protein